MATSTDQRFVAQEKLTPDAFVQLATARSVTPLRARKIGYVVARQALSHGRVETRWNGKETANTAVAGDWIVTNLAADRTPLKDDAGNLNIYVIAAARFGELYEPTGNSIALGQVYRAKGTVQAIALPSGFDILAPWGERQQAARGYLILNGTEVYGNNAETFEATYEVVGP